MSHILLFADAESLISYGGFFLICLLIFCSVGLFFCFFFPVGGVLFAVGILAATGDTLPHIFTVCLLLTISSVAGGLAGYFIGRSTGNFFYTRKDSRFYRRSYLASTEAFYKKYGTLAMAGGYFLPIVRTFAPVLAGIMKIKFQRFLLLSIIGSAMFISAFVLAGYLVGSLPFLRPWIKYIVAFFVLAVTIPMVGKTIKAMRKPPGA